MTKKTPAKTGIRMLGASELVSVRGGTDLIAEPGKIDYPNLQQKLPQKLPA